MDKEVALKAIEQFPHFKSLVGETLNSLEQRYESAQKFSWKSQKKVHEAFQFYRQTLNRELEREKLSVEERFSILEMMREAVNRESEKDSEHKAFTIKMVTIAATVGVAAIGTAVAALGGKAGFGSGGDRA
jgi:DNA-directed RNA polymerase beta' subunit